MKEGNKDFIVALEKDMISVSFDWISKELDLNFENASENQLLSSEEDDFGISSRGDRKEKVANEEWV